MPCPKAALSALGACPLSSPTKDTASLSKPIPAFRPELVHTLHQEQTSVLSVAADEKHIFSGSQGNDIYVWNRITFKVETTLQGHMGSVLALEIARDRGWLFSSSGDSTVRVWCIKSLKPVYVINPYLDSGAGDLFSMAYCPSLQLLYLGCQNGSLQWFDLKRCPQKKRSGREPAADDTEPVVVDDPRPLVRHKFFDSQPQYLHGQSDGFSSGRSTPSTVHDDKLPRSHCTLRIPFQNAIDSAHYGYVYSMALLPSPMEGVQEGDTSGKEDIFLVTGSGDETVNLWKCNPSPPTLVHTFEGCNGAVLSLVARNGTVYAGCQDGLIKVWDLETKTLVRTLIVQEGVDVLSLSMVESDLYSCSANGQVQRWDASFNCTASWPAHRAIVLSSVITSCLNNSFWLITGASDNHIKLWKVERPGSVPIPSDDTEGDDWVSKDHQLTNDTMVYALSKFVSIPSVSSDPSSREYCRQAAMWLKKCLTQLGAEATLLPTGDGVNPLVMAVFQGSMKKPNRPRLLFYGHYDVISAPQEGWMTEPFTLTGKNGYLYGRGATDNKGPILAVACATSELLSRRALDCDVVFLVEGEGEAGSAGFVDAVISHKKVIGKIDAILVSNSTWIADDQPCITYGLRGVVHATVEIMSGNQDLHSGVDGGAVCEPMVDMVGLLSTLFDGKKVAIPHFYDSVRSQTPEEQELYQILSKVTNKPPASLASRWSEPSLSIHNLEVSGPGNPTVIPATVKARVSIRTVPDQDVDTIMQALTNHLLSSFEKLNSPNKINVSIDKTADWWLGELDDPKFKALECAVRDEWGVSPLRIREGGSIPSVPRLERLFGCRALHLPLGQSSDQAHLVNERISLTNLTRGKSVIQRFLSSVSESPPDGE